MKPYVLVVEDNKIESLRLTKILEVSGYIPIQAFDGLSALDACEKYNIDAALVDIQMPHMDGFTFLERLNRMDKNKIFPVIMMTASRHETKHIKEAVHLGAKDFVVKPIDAEILASKLSGLLKNRVDWSERVINDLKIDTFATAKLGLQVHSISEMGIRVISPMPLDSNKFMELDWAVLTEFGIGTVNLKVVDCEPTTGGYSIYLSFLGLPEHQLKKLRQLCLKVGVNQRQMELNTKDQEKP